MPGYPQIYPHGGAERNGMKSDAQASRLTNPGVQCLAMGVANSRHEDRQNDRDTRPVRAHSLIAEQR
jgi:hypothetical protein